MAKIFISGWIRVIADSLQIFVCGWLRSNQDIIRSRVIADFLLWTAKIKS